MPFDPTIPQATDQLSVSQGQILNNFTVLGAIAGNANNSSASLNALSGFNWVYLPTNGASIPPAASAFAAGNVALYSATYPVTGKNELFVNKQNQATTVQIPATASTLSFNSAPLPNVNNDTWSYLPSGMLMKFAGNAATVNGVQTIVYPVGANIPVFTQVLVVVISVSDVSLAAAGIQTYAKLVDPTSSPLQFTYAMFNATATSGIRYIAIGY